MKQAENHKSHPRWSWATNQMGNPDSNYVRVFTQPLAGANRLGRCGGKPRHESAAAQLWSLGIMHTMISNIGSRMIVVAAVLVTLVHSANGQQSTNISKTDVQAVLDSIDKACLKKDAAAVIANYASNAVITATIVGSDFPATPVQFDNIDSFKGDLEMGFVADEDYSFQRKQISIEMGSGGETAQCSFTEIATYRFRGKMEKDVIKESIFLAKLGSKVLITKDHSDVKTTR